MKFPGISRFSRIPGSESTHLDLEKLFLLSDSMENLIFYGKIEISESENKMKKMFLGFLLTKPRTSQARQNVESGCRTYLSVIYKTGAMSNRVLPPK